jgi:hypothetical protein
MDYGVEAPQRIRLLGYVFGFIDVGQIAYDDVLGSRHVLLSVLSAFRSARMQDDLVTVIG